MKFASDYIQVRRNKWEIQPTPLRPGRLCVIEWSKLLPSNVGSGHQREYLLKSSKGLLAAWITTSRNSQLAGGSIDGIFRKLRRLVRWMIRRDLWRFGELSEGDITNFLLGLTEEKSMAFDSVAKYALLFHKMWELRAEYVGALRQDPFFLVDNHRIFGGLRRHSPWKAIDEREALPLIRDALNWMNEKAPILQTIADKLWATGLRCIGRRRQERTEILSAAYCEIEETDAYRELSILIGMGDVNSRQVIRRLFAVTEGAAAIVIFFLVGMRASEMLALNVNALTRLLHSDGHTFEYLQGVAAKKNGKSKGWIASPYVTDALRKVNMLFHGPRTYAKREHIFISFYGTNGYPLPGARISWTNSCTIAKKMRLFANASFRIEAPFKARLHPHAGRKTFARFVTQRDKRALGALAHHYGHAHRIFTDSNYVGGDIELAAMISEENRRDLAEGLTEILRSSNLSGKASGLLRLAVKNETAKPSMSGRRVIEKMVDRLIDEGVTLAPCDWGYCVYAQAFSACGGDSAGPNPVERAPDVCGKCTNFVVTERHRSWWEERVRDASVFLSHPGLTGQSIAVIERRRDTAEQILRKLNVAHQKVTSDVGK